MNRHDITFETRGETLRGHLYLPDGPGPYPALVFTGPYTGVKEQVTGTYARELAERGFAALAFDHRNFGESDGAIRQHEEPPKKIEDLVAATSFLAAREDVDADRIGAVGICLGGSYALRHAALDPRIGALATIAAAYLDPHPDGDEAAANKARWLERFADELGRLDAGEPTRIPAVSDDPDTEVGMPGREPFDYYGTDRAASPHWRNEITRLSSYNLAAFDAVLGADLLVETPALVVHGTTDAFCSPENAATVHERMRGEKALHWIETENHIALYDSAPHVADAVERTAAWMNAHLGRD